MYEMQNGMEGVLSAFYIIYLLFTLGISVAVYVLQSWSFYTIAKRRGIKKPWLAWIPVGDMWIKGCISDQYQYVVKGQVKNKRKWLLGLNLAMWGAYVLFFVAFGTLVVDLIADTYGTEYFGVGGLLGMIVAFVAMMGFCIAIIVLQYMALYDLYRSCDPSDAVLFLVLSILIPICQIIFPLVCRKKDLGMPPRKQQPVEPTYMPPQPVADPWENNPEE